MHTTGHAAGAPRFEPPRATSLPGGGVRIVAWVSRPSGGMVRATTYDHDRVQHDFDGDGHLTTRVLQSASIPILPEPLPPQCTTLPRGRRDDP